MRHRLAAPILVAVALVARTSRAEDVATFFVGPIAEASTEDERAISAAAETRFTRAGYTAARDADVIVMTRVERTYGCEVVVTGVQRGGGATEAHEPCEPSVVAAADRAIRAVLVLLPPPPRRAPVTPPPAPVTPHAPPPGDAWVFEAGVRLRTGTFVGLGQTVLGDDETTRFRGLFSAAIVRSEIDDFAGAFSLAFGKAKANRFRGLVAVGLLTNEADDLAAVATVGIRKTQAKSFKGAFELTVGLSEADRFAGVAQLGAMDAAGDFTGVAQVGVLTVSKQSFAGLAQIGGANVAEHEFAGGAQLGVVNLSTDGTLRAAVQAGWANFVEREVQVGVQIGIADLFGRFRGGAQIAVANFDGSKSIGDYFGTAGASSRTDFEGALQAGAYNAIHGGFEGGAQLGVVNQVGGSFHGGVQIGTTLNIVAGDVEAGVAIAPGNLTLRRFSGLAQIGGGNLARSLEGSQVGMANLAVDSLRGAQIGAFNIADDARGVQIGLFNRASTLKGIQLGVVNWIADRATLPVLPIVNVGL